MENGVSAASNETSKRKAATTASINISKKYASCNKRVTSLLRKKSGRKISKDEEKLLEENKELVEQFYKRKEQRDVWKSRLAEQEDTPEILQKKVKELAQAIHDAQYLVVYTGAGISTAASIPDYRGPNGIWTLLQKGREIGSHDLSAAEPTRTHMALAELHRLGVVRHIVSQNCDGLHLRSGIPKTSISEVHGNMYIEVCKHCIPPREYVRTFDVTERTSTFKHTTGRRCYKCGEPLIDTIVHFGERGKLRWPLNWQGACQAANACDTIVCLGSSLKVLRKYPWLWQMDRHSKRRPRLYIVNLQWTPKDKDATLKINGKCDEVMDLVLKSLNIPLPSYSRIDDPIFNLATVLHSKEESTTSRPRLSKPSKTSDESVKVETSCHCTHNVPTAGHGADSCCEASRLNSEKKNGLSEKENIESFGLPRKFTEPFASSSTLPSKILNTLKDTKNENCIDSLILDGFSKQLLNDDKTDLKLFLEKLKSDPDIADGVKLDLSEKLKLKEDIKEDIKPDISCNETKDKLNVLCLLPPDNKQIKVETDVNLLESFNDDKMFKANLVPISLIETPIKNSISNISIARSNMDQKLPSINQMAINKSNLDQKLALENPTEFLTKTNLDQKIDPEIRAEFLTKTNLDQKIVPENNEASPSKTNSDQIMSIDVEMATLNKSNLIQKLSCENQLSIPNPEIPENVDNFPDKNLMNNRLSDNFQEKTSTINSSSGPEYFKLTLSLPEVPKESQALLKQSDFYGTGLCVRTMADQENCSDEELEEKIYCEDLEKDDNLYTDNCSSMVISSSHEDTIAQMKVDQMFSKDFNEIDNSPNIIEKTNENINNKLTKNNSDLTKNGPINQNDNDLTKNGPVKYINTISESEELKSIWYNSFNTVGTKLSPVKTLPTVRNLSTSHEATSILLKNICRQAYKNGNENSVDRQSPNYELQNLWFWGFDTNPSPRSDTPPAPPSPQEDKITPTEENSTDSSDSKKEPDADGPKDTDVPRRITRSRTRTSTDVKETPPEPGCHCDGFNPQFCKTAQPLPELDDDILRARTVLARKRTYNYRRYDPVFEVTLDSFTYERTKHKRKRKRRVEFIEDSDDPDRGSCDDEDRNIEVDEIEAKVSDEDVDTPDIKAEKKICPGWYGKGYRKIIRKKPKT